MTAHTPQPTRQIGRSGAWLVLAVLLLFSIAAPLNQFKAPPIMPILMEQLRLSVGGAGLLMSVFAITGLVLALPAGLIYQKAGPRWTGLLAGGSVALGATLGALSPSTNLLLISRVVEGIGTSLVAVLARPSSRSGSQLVRGAQPWAFGPPGYPSAPPPCSSWLPPWPRGGIGAPSGGWARAMPWPLPCSTWLGCGRPRLQPPFRAAPASNRRLSHPPAQCYATAPCGGWRPPSPPSTRPPWGWAPTCPPSWPPSTVSR
ncbi:MAG: MFS transporter [Chloroflexi bacterium]|nr:MFS transporter [Chloroflexota bacterium]